MGDSQPPLAAANQQAGIPVLPSFPSPLPENHVCSLDWLSQLSLLKGQEMKPSPVPVTRSMTLLGSPRAAAVTSVSLP